jgi:hypothetical protein
MGIDFVRWRLSTGGPLAQVLRHIDPFVRDSPITGSKRLAQLSQSLEGSHEGSSGRSTHRQRRDRRSRGPDQQNPPPRNDPLNAQRGRCRLDANSRPRSRGSTPPGPPPSPALARHPQSGRALGPSYQPGQLSSLGMQRKVVTAESREGLFDFGKDRGISRWQPEASDRVQSEELRPSIAGPSGAASIGVEGKPRLAPCRCVRGAETRTRAELAFARRAAERSMP